MRECFARQQRGYDPLENVRKFGTIWHFSKFIETSRQNASRFCQLKLHRGFCREPRFTPQSCGFIRKWQSITSFCTLVQSVSENCTAIRINPSRCSKCTQTSTVSETHEQSRQFITTFWAAWESITSFVCSPQLLFLKQTDNPVNSSRLSGPFGNRSRLSAPSTIVSETHTAIPSIHHDVLQFRQVLRIWDSGCQPYACHQRANKKEQEKAEQQNKPTQNRLWMLESSS